MRRNFRRRLAVLVIHFELLLLVDRAVRFGGNDHAFVEHHLAQRFAEVGVLADHFGDDVARAFERFVDAGDAFFGVDEGRREFGERHGRGFLVPEIQRQRFETFLARDGGFGAAFGLVGQVEVFEFALVEVAIRCGRAVRPSVCPVPRMVRRTVSRRSSSSRK